MNELKAGDRVAWSNHPDLGIGTVLAVGRNHRGHQEARVRWQRTFPARSTRSP